MSNVRDLAIKDWSRFSKSAFNLELAFCSPSPSNAQVKVLGIGTRNFIDVIRSDGQDAVANVVHIGFSEAELLAVNPTYPVRDKEGIISIVGHRVSFKDANGVLRDYAVKTIFPDETVGMIMCDCELFKPVV